MLGIYKHLFKGKEDVGRLLLLSALFLSNKIFTEPEACCLSPTGCSVSAQAMPIYLQVLDLRGTSGHAQLSPKLLWIQTQAFMLAQQVLYPQSTSQSLGSLFPDHNLEKNSHKISYSVSEM